MGTQGQAPARMNLSTMQAQKSHEEVAYERYQEYCRRVGVAPMSAEGYEKQAAKIHPQHGYTTESTYKRSGVSA